MGEKKTTKKRKEKRDPNAPKKPLSGYQIYLQDKSQELRSNNPGIDAKEVFSLVAKEWQQLTQPQKDRYQKDLAEYEENKESKRQRLSDDNEETDSDEEKRSKKKKKDKKKKSKK